jgi:hypothetical protein
MIKENIGKWVTVVYFEGDDKRTCQGKIYEEGSFLLIKGDFKTTMLKEKNIDSIKIAGEQDENKY